MGSELCGMRTQERDSHLPLTPVPFRRIIVFFVLATVGVAVDLGSKSYVFADLGFPGRQGSWVQDFFGGWMTFRFLTSINEGALWGIGQGKSWLFAALSVVAVVGVLLAVLRFGAIRSRWLMVSLALILAGTLGNLWDRAGLHGCRRPDGTTIFGVRDFLLFTFGTFHWPIFNFADVFLVTGSIMLGLHSVQAEAAQTAGAAAPDLASRPEALHKPAAG